MIIRFFLRIYVMIPMPIAITMVKRYIKLMVMFFCVTHINVVSIFAFACMFPSLLFYFLPSFPLYHIRWVCLCLFLFFSLLLVDNILHRNNLLIMIIIRYTLHRRIWLWFTPIWILPFMTIIRLQLDTCGDASVRVLRYVLHVCVHDARYDDVFPFFCIKG